MISAFQFLSCNVSENGETVDFDVGKIGFGRKNFTEAFATTDEFKKLVDLGYVEIRYPEGNTFGVRYEPWHIKVV